MLSLIHIYGATCQHLVGYAEYSQQDLMGQISTKEAEVDAAKKAKDKNAQKAAQDELDKLKEQLKMCIRDRHGPLIRFSTRLFIRRKVCSLCDMYLLRIRSYRYRKILSQCWIMRYLAIL